MSWSNGHLLDVDEQSLDSATLERVLRLAADFRDDTSRATLRGLMAYDIALLFAEPSTRTRLSFEMAARHLGARTYVVEPGSSSMVKGETLVDTVRTLDAIGFNMLVVRHHRSGAPWVAARYFDGHVVNAGDGWHAHPTQALVDLFTMRRAVGDLAGRKVTIVGDIRHSRVAKSNIWTLTRAGADVWLCGPDQWLRGLESVRATVTSDLEAALDSADAVMALRVQKERMAPGVAMAEYIQRYQITEARLAQFAPRAVFLHPGPINEGVEVTREVARGPRSLVLEQARNGVPIRVAVLAMLAASRPRASEPRAATTSYAGTRG